MLFIGFAMLCIKYINYDVGFCLSLAIWFWFSFHSSVHSWPLLFFIFFFVLLCISKTYQKAINRVTSHLLNWKWWKMFSFFLRLCWVCSGSGERKSMNKKVLLKHLMDLNANKKQLFNIGKWERERARAKRGGGCEGLGTVSSLCEIESIWVLGNSFEYWIID